MAELDEDWSRTWGINSLDCKWLSRVENRWSRRHSLVGDGTKTGYCLAHCTFDEMTLKSIQQSAYRPNENAMEDTISLRPSCKSSPQT